ncbi:Potato inhibitor I family protein [Nitzschia inconspicua]|uniref:Potato inhibitor I family protein n=1 Tax=Nitzschia inconspicua TaxID=303405 RepID=A0A9K3PK19_9STRA|nr:Potato inhibitor I family protein [Nitzschia inconspicua]KAG7350083.1 Potato inhibitor I family protein [Nitzschia inconspicua]
MPEHAAPTISVPTGSGEETSRGLFRRRSTTSPEKLDRNLSPKSLENVDLNEQLDDHQSTTTAEDESGSEDLEMACIEGNVESAKCCNYCTKRSILLFVAWLLVVTGLTVGLYFAFHTKDETTVSSSSSMNQSASNPPDSDRSVVATFPPWEFDDETKDVATNDPQNPAIPHATRTPDVNADSIFNQTKVLDSDGNNSTKPSTPNKPQLFEFPYLVGLPAEQAKEQLETEFGVGTYDIIILPENSPVTKDFLFDRIRLFVDSTGIISEVPRVG